MPAANVPRAGDYGIDAPPVVRNLILGGAAGLLLAATIYGLHGAGLSGLVRMLYCTGLFAGLSWLATGLLMIYGSKVRKLRLRDRLLDELALRGDELVPQPVRRFVTSGGSPNGLCSTASSARTWPRSSARPPIAIPAATSRPSSPRSSIGICAAASFATASPVSAVRPAATSCSSLFRAKKAACVRLVRPGAWPILRRIFVTAFCRRCQCASGSSRSRGDFGFYWHGGPSQGNRKVVRRKTVGP